MTINDSISRSSGFAVAEESVAGTAETAPDVYEYLISDPGLNPVQNTLIHRSILSRSAYNASVASYHMEGNLDVLADPDSLMGWLLKWGLGSVASVQQGATTAYKHTYTAGDTLPTFTTWFKRGGSQQIKIPYCMIKSLTFNQAVDAVLSMSAAFVGKTENITTDFGTESYSQVIPFANSNLTVSIAGTPSTAAHASSITIDNGIDVAMGRVHGSLFYNSLVPGNRTITGSFSLYFNDDTEYQRFWGDVAATTPSGVVDSVALVFHWDSGIDAGTATPYALDIEIPAAIYTSNSVNISGTRVVQTLGFESISDGTSDIDVYLINKKTGYV